MKTGKTFSQAYDISMAFITDINTDADNALFDERFYDIAQAIADGILETIG